MVTIVVKVMRTADKNSPIWSRNDCKQENYNGNTSHKTDDNTTGFKRELWCASITALTPWIWLPRDFPFSTFLFSINLPILKVYRLYFVYIWLQWISPIFVVIQNSWRTPFCPRDSCLSSFALLISIIICYVFHSFSFRFFPVRSRSSSGLLPFF